MISKEKLADMIEDSIHECFPLFLEHMDVDQFNKIKSALGMAICATLFRIKKYNKKEENGVIEHVEVE